MKSQVIPPERDLPAGRLTTMKDELMAQIEQMDQHGDGRDGNEEAVPSPTARPRRRRLALTAVAVVLGLALGGVFALSGDDSASASPNFAAPTDDGFIRIHVADLDDPEQIERDLAAVGVPAVVDIHEGGGYRCDPNRSDGWVTEANQDLLPELVPEGYEDVPDDDRFDFRIDPDALRPGETVAVELFWDEHDGEWATMSSVRTSMSPIGACELVEDDGIVVDAENAIVGGL